MAGKLHVSLITPKATKVDVMADALVAQTMQGQVTILDDHAAMLATLDMGKIEVRMEGAVQRFFTAGGLLEVQDNRAVLLLQSAERVEDIDATRAEQEAAAAEARFAQLGPDHADYTRQAKRLARAQARLQITREQQGL
jgi:F-type H+-transporting ATPase subunit epsilon